MLSDNVLYEICVCKNMRFCLIILIVFGLTNIGTPQSKLSVTEYPFRAIDVRCKFDFETLIENIPPNEPIPTQFLKVDSYYTYADICDCSNMYGIDYSKESLLLIMEAEGYNNTNISANHVFVLKDKKRRKIVCVIKKNYCGRWEYFGLGWDVIGVVIPKVPPYYRLEFLVDYTPGKSYEEVSKEN